VNQAKGYAIGSNSFMYTTRPKKDGVFVPFFIIRNASKNGKLMAVLVLFLTNLY